MSKVLQQTWWDSNLKTKMDEFKGWVGDHNAESKSFFRNYIKKNNLKFNNMLDVGCGPATEYYGFKNDLIDIDYTGVDSSVILNQLNKEKNINMLNAEAHNIPVSDSSFDLVYCRHVLEHQPSFESVLKELIRCTKKLAIHIFFIKPEEKEQINYDSNSNLYHNKYSKLDIELFLKNTKKIKKFEWQEINKSENILLMWV